MPIASTKNEYVYNRQFYERIDPGCRQSAARVVPKLLELVRPQSVVDVGCATSAWLAEFQRRDTEILGIDGAWVPREMLHIPVNKFVPWD